MKYFVLACWVVLATFMSCRSNQKSPQQLLKPAFTQINLPIPPKNVFAKSRKGVYALQGIWVRQDLAETIKKTHSLFEAKKIIEVKPWNNLLALGIMPANKDSLIVCISGFATQMPVNCYLKTPQVKPVSGYKTQYPNFVGEGKISLFLSLSGKSLVMLVQQGAKRNKLVFQKFSTLKDDFVCANQTNKANYYALAGNYILKDKKGKILQSKIWFDQQSNTNFPGFKNYRVAMGYWHSVHHAIQARNTSELERADMLKKGAIDQEDFLELSNQNSNKSFILHKTKNGFDIYSQKTERLMMWGLAYKKEWMYKLERKK